MSSNKDTLENDYERMVPEFHQGTLTYAEHMTRYLSAQKVVAGKVVLDIASGAGYGTRLLAETAKKVYGVDVNEVSVNYARKHYGATNIEYKVGDGIAIPLEDNAVDVVVTFETIEHIKDYQKFMKELSRVLKDDGLLIISTPNDIEFAEGNHFHLHEFEYDELIRLVKKDFKNVDSYYQGTWKYVAVGPKKPMETEGSFEIETLNFSPKTDEQYLYFYLLCSNRTITETVEPIAALGEHYSDRALVAAESAVRQKQAESDAHIAELEVVNKDLRKHYEQISATLNAITGSKSYKLARKLGTVNHKLKRPLS